MKKCGCEKDVFACRAHAHPQPTVVCYECKKVYKNGMAGIVLCETHTRAVKAYEKDQEAIRETQLAAKAVCQVFSKTSFTDAREDALQRLSEVIAKHEATQ